MPSRRARHRGWAITFVLAALLVVATTLSGCGGAATPPSSGAGSSGAPVSSAPPTDDTGATDSPLVVDAGLLGVLPASVAGIAMQPSPDTAAGMIDDPGLAANASAVAVGVVAGAGASQNDDFAVSTVVQLRPGVFSDGFYRDWRAAYDTAACQPAGGVADQVQQQIGAHTVEVTDCTEGARTYHTHLAGDRLVSITAVGDRSFGNLVMAGLRQ